MYLAGYATTRIHRFPGVPGEERAVRILAPQDSMGQCPGEGSFTMSSAQFVHRPITDWWESLGLRLQEDKFSFATEEILRTHIPVAFQPTEGADNVSLGLDQLVRRITGAERESAVLRTQATKARRASDVAEFESASEKPNAHERVDEGRWAGFTRGEAAAWCWNLFQFEPHGFVHPGSEVRARALSELRGVGLPEVFGYPERARELADRGVTPQQYREYRDALGSPMFDEEDVRRR